jgi:hypothetical protein
MGVFILVTEALVRGEITSGLVVSELDGICLSSVEANCVSDADDEGRMKWAGTL